MHLQIIDTTNTRSDGKVHSHQSITSPYFEVKDVKAERATMLRFTKHEQVCFTVRKHEIAPPVRTTGHNSSNQCFAYRIENQLYKPDTNTGLIINQNFVFIFKNTHTCNSNVQK